jgi:hypothetical protein
MATAPLAWLRSITSVSTVGYTRHWALWTVAATERGLVILESGGRHAAAGRGRSGEDVTVSFSRRKWAKPRRGGLRHIDPSLIYRGLSAAGRQRSAVPTPIGLASEAALHGAGAHTPLLEVL